MKRLFLLTCCLIAFGVVWSAPPDSLFALHSPGGWTLLQRVSNGETLPMLSRRFHVPSAILAQANSLSETDYPRPGSLAIIPLGPYNLLHNPPQTMSEVRPLYYRVAIGDHIYDLARRIGVPSRMLAERNGLGDNEPSIGHVLLLAWIRYDSTPFGDPMHLTDPPPVTRPIDTPLPPPAKDTLLSIPKPEHPTLSQLYKEQTAEGQNVVTERGSVGFYPLTGNTSGAAVYAFHNAAYKGAVMIVRNINNGKAIYVKVLGPLPQTKAFAGCILGLSNKAKAALGVRENKAFCELSYPGN